MPRIPDKAYFDFSGGIRRDKSPFVLRDNELQIGKNFDIDEQGRIIKRRGMQAFGNLASSFFNYAAFYNANTGGTNRLSTYIADTSNNFYILATTNLTTTITTASTTIALDAGGDFTDPAGGGPHYIEIEGDIIGYTDRDGNSLTGVTGISFGHSAGASVHQWSAGSGLTSSAIGVYFATLNDNLLVNSSDVFNEDDHTDAALANSASTPVVVFLTTFKTRAYGAGDGSANGPVTRVFYSALNDGTSWTPASDYFDVEDSRNEPITGIKEYNNNLLFLKPNSFFRYNLASLQQANTQVGAYNHFVVQEINGLLYTFCPAGIFVTNGSSAKNIGEPVGEYWKNFHPIFDGTYNRIVTNCSAGRWKHFYLLYIGDVTLDDSSSLSDVVLVYNTITESWTVYDGFTNLINFISLDMSDDNEDQLQFRPRLFFSSTSLGLYQCFDSRTLDETTERGGDITQDMLRSTGTPITLNIKTKPYDLGYPNFRKEFGYLKVFAERPGMHISYQIDDDDPKPLGLVDKKIKRFQFPSNAKGYRCTIIIDESSMVAPMIYNGHIFEDCSILDKNV